MSPDRAAELGQVARELRRALAPGASERDRGGGLPHDAFETVRRSGLGALLVPARHGGAGLGFSALADAVIQLAAGDASFAQSLQPHYIFLERVRLMGSEVQRQRYLGAAARGVLFGNAMSEIGGPPGAWSTRLSRAGAGWRLDGRKFYATGSAIAELTFVGALDETGQKVLAVVPMGRQGVSLGDDWQAMGQRGTASGSAVFEGVELAADEIIPLAPWEKRRHHTGAGSQIIHCAIDAGIAAAALDDAVDFARHRARPSRDSGHQRVVDDPVAHAVVGEIAARVFAAEAAVLLAAQRLDSAAEALHAHQASPVGDGPDEALIAASVAVASAKIVSSEAALFAGQKLFEVGGSSASASALNLDRRWRNARTHTLHDPLAQKFLAIGRHLLADIPPPNSFTY